jgi:radical SAM family protein/4Fe-4S single cluster protein
VANIVLTTTCNRACPYCFAGRTMAQFGDEQMAFLEVVRIVDLIAASGRNHVSLLGGEPTLHRRFLEILEYVLERRMEVTVFTNALASKATIEGIARLRQLQRVKFVVNVNAPEIDDHMARQEAFMRALPGRCDVSHNICLYDRSFGFLAEMIERTGLKDCRIRVSLAQPIAEKENAFIAPEHYAGVARHLVELAEAVMPRGIKVNLDCGWPLCIFSDEQLGKLRRVGADLKFVCQTAVDFAPGNVVWTCYPLMSVSRRTWSWETPFDALADGFMEKNRELRAKSERGAGVFDACTGCVYLAQGHCAGGCLAHLVKDAPRA